VPRHYKISSSEPIFATRWLINGRQRIAATYKSGQRWLFPGAPHTVLGVLGRRAVGTTYWPLLPHRQMDLARLLNVYRDLHIVLIEGGTPILISQVVDSPRHQVWKENLGNLDF
jgi:hypothetical protein